MAGWLGVIAWLWLRRAAAACRCRSIPSCRPTSRGCSSSSTGNRWPLLAWKRRTKTTVLVSLSADGSLQARACSRCSASMSFVARARAAARVASRRSCGGCAAAMTRPSPSTVRGGPYGVVKPGARAAARAVGGVLVPMGSAIAAGGGKVLERAWDRYAIAVAVRARRHRPRRARRSEQRRAGDRGRERGGGGAFGGAPAMASAGTYMVGSTAV